MSDLIPNHQRVYFMPATQLQDLVDMSDDAWYQYIEPVIAWNANVSGNLLHPLTASFKDAPVPFVLFFPTNKGDMSGSPYAFFFDLFDDKAVPRRGIGFEDLKLDLKHESLRQQRDGGDC